MYHKHSCTFLPLDTIEKMRRKEAKRPGNVSSPMPEWTPRLQLNIHFQVYCDIKWKLHLHMHVRVVWHLSYPLSTHTHTHSPIYTNTLPEGDCEEDAVRVKWSSEAARQKNEWSDWHRSSRQGLPGLFLKCWCLELRHTLCSSSGVSGKHAGVWSSLTDNWKNTEMLQNKHSLLLH